MPTTPDLLPELEAACDKLLWRSETDSPFEVVFLPSGQKSEPIAQLLNQYPADTSVTISSLNDFFAPAMIERAWFDSRELERVQRYRNLRDLLETTLENLQVYRIGETEIDVYMLGVTEDKQVVGVKTKVVET
ncbi:MAG: nuclease A inhibitor family protein [Cyanobacteria bacterium P01_D01_bin.56]